ncbi:MAG: S-methyl-5-thioribose-1-phosphate isomerase [Chloroflexi bacterium]|nr:S-methyl-5-thioribose-1-phosphate isomerase [Chloroflexota bacterium]
MFPQLDFSRLALRSFLVAKKRRTPSRRLSQQEGNVALSGAGEFSPIIWTGDSVRLIDQTRLPMEEVWVEISNYREIVEAIRGMMVRGAPAIGIAGAYGLALAAMELSRAANGGFSDELGRAAIEIKTARPTGANLAWAVDRLLCAARNAQSVEEVITDLTSEAVKIHKEDLDFNHAIGRNGARLIPWGSQVLTHCNAGALATGGYGTALGVIRTAWSDQRIERVFATETRPLLQGARLTAWELAQAGIPTSLVSDSSAGQLMKKGMVQAVFVGADRIAANGDVANKIGTYTLAVLAKETGVPFYVAAPTSTLDMSLSSGDEIPIEERDSSEVLEFAGQRTAAVGVDAVNFAFDVTPSRYVNAIITERGVARSPYRRTLNALLESDLA